MAKILYARYLSPAISAQFTLEMCRTPKSRIYH